MACSTPLSAEDYNSILSILDGQLQLGSLPLHCMVLLYFAPDAEGRLRIASHEVRPTAKDSTMEWYIAYRCLHIRWHRRVQRIRQAIAPAPDNIASVLASILREDKARAGLGIDRLYILDRLRQVCGCSMAEAIAWMLALDVSGITGSLVRGL